MTFDIPGIAARLATAMIASLRSDSGKVKALVIAEGESLAHAFAQIAGMVAQGQIDTEEAAVLIRIQRDASEAVLTSLGEVSRAAAHKAVGLGMKDIIGQIERIIGGSLLGELP